MTPRLWHFTCEHGYAGLGEAGTLRPHAHVLIPELGPILWLTTDKNPSRDAVGLTSSLLSCDRMQYRYRVTPTKACMAWLRIREHVNAEVRDVLESYGEPATWWISREPLEATLDHRYEAAA